ncbi:MAG: glycosyltransferase family 4 protein [Verrucomicrobia bacterium]|nr:glycosyltransferase family 4 protein [Verrucomicrobiota bacterium]
MILMSHPVGNENVRQAALGFAEAGLLDQFWTTINWDPDSPLDRVLPDKIRRTLRRRTYPPTVRKRTRALPFRETARLLLGAMNVGSFSQHETGWLSIDAISRELDRHIAEELSSKDANTCVYAYEDCALESFRAAERRGQTRIYDLPIGYWRAAQRIFSDEREREPEWSATLTGTRDSAEKLAWKDEELRLAQRVVVASAFTQSTLSESPAKYNVAVVPYGGPPVHEGDLLNCAGKLRILFAGSLGQRKGLSYALRAVEMIGREHCELTLLGRMAANDCPVLDAAVRRHRWIPTLSHAEVLREMREHDIVLFPSLFEGFGLVITEAMSQGTPVITTPHTAGPDIIDDGVDGFIVPIRSAETIAQKLDLLASEPHRLQAMKMAAREKARRRTWENYRRQLVAVAREVMNS